MFACVKKIFADLRIRTIFLYISLSEQPEKVIVFFKAQIRQYFLNIM